MIPGIGKLQWAITAFLSKERPRKVLRLFQAGFLGVTVLLVSFILFYPYYSQPDLDLGAGGNFAVGKNAPRRVSAVSVIEFPRTAQYELAREAAAHAVPPYFSRDLRLLESGESVDLAGSKVRTLRSYVNEDMEGIQRCLRETKNVVAAAQCSRQKLPRLRGLPDNELSFLVSGNIARSREQLIQLVNLVYQRFIVIDALPPGSVEASGLSVLDIRSRTEMSVSTLPLEFVILKPDLWRFEVRGKVEDIARGVVHLHPEPLVSALSHLCLAYLNVLPSSLFDAKSTEKARREAVSRVSVPMYKINRGEDIVKKDEVITDDIYQALQHYNRGRFLEKLSRIASILVQQAFLLGLLVYFAIRFNDKRIHNITSNLIIFLMIWGFALVVFFVESLWAVRFEYNEGTHFLGAWVPIGFFVILLSVIFGEVLSVPVGIYMAFIVFTASNYDGTSFLISFSVALLSSVLGSRIRRRQQFFNAAIFLVLIVECLVTAGYMFSSRPILGTSSGGTLFSPNYLDALKMGFFGSFTSAGVIAALPLFETLFNIPTRFRLLELAEPSNPLLQEMIRRAPSTWTHTLMVAALSERAAEKLGLNTELVRTGVYYHDIGKLKNAEFFIENQHLIPKPEHINKRHPQQAAEIIIDHVLHGIELARRARLPKEVIDFIPEHHGTSTMSFFYHKALEKMKRRVRREAFRYPGPIPQSRETAVVMIADSVEAASRSLETADDHTIDAMVHRIIALKQNEGQLEQSGLRLDDLRIIQDSFREVLLSSLHGRPKYPDAAETERLEARQKP